MGKGLEHDRQAEVNVLYRDRMCCYRSFHKFVNSPPDGAGSLPNGNDTYTGNGWGLSYGDT